MISGRNWSGFLHMANRAGTLHFAGRGVGRSCCYFPISPCVAGCRLRIIVYIIGITTVCAGVRCVAARCARGINRCAGSIVMTELRNRNGLNLFAARTRYSLCAVDCAGGCLCYGFGSAEIVTESRFCSVIFVVVMG